MQHYLLLTAYYLLLTTYYLLLTTYYLLLTTYHLLLTTYLMVLGRCVPLGLVLHYSLASYCLPLTARCVLLGLVKYRPKVFSVDATPELREIRSSGVIRGEQLARSLEMQEEEALDHAKAVGMVEGSRLTHVKIDVRADRRMSAPPPPKTPAPSDLYALAPRGTNVSQSLPLTPRSQCGASCGAAASNLAAAKAAGGGGSWRAERSGGGGAENGSVVSGEVSACDVVTPLAAPGTPQSRRAGRGSVMRAALSSSGARSLSRERLGISTDAQEEGWSGRSGDASSRSAEISSRPSSRPSSAGPARESTAAGSTRMSAAAKASKAARANAAARREGRAATAGDSERPSQRGTTDPSKSAERDRARRRADAMRRNAGGR